MVNLPDKCCFYCQLQTGGVILGWLGIISATFSIVFASVSFGFITQIAELIMEKEVNEDAVPTVLGTFIALMLVCFLILNIIALIASICLVIGTIKNKHLLLLPWLVSELGAIILFGLFLIFDFFSLFANNGIDVGEKFLSFVFSFIFLVFDIYLWLCVCSLYHKIKQENVETHGNEMAVSHETNDGLPAYKNLA
uniref:CSON013003 protein n=1 Tax=Culicoides sonorensis TaxID=179676 RepID=A0A336LRF1_CULSO